jgi:hypothetical protein
MFEPFEHMNRDLRTLPYRQAVLIRFHILKRQRKNAIHMVLDLGLRTYAHQKIKRHNKHLCAIANVLRDNGRHKMAKAVFRARIL